MRKINEIQAFLEGEIQKREALIKTYFRASREVDNIDTALVTVTLVAGASGIGLLSTVVAVPAVIALEGAAALSGLLIWKYSVRISTSKAEKHEKIKTIAHTKLNTISSHISKTLSDNKITDEEFQLI